jgi:hypothetical protein
MKQVRVQELKRTPSASGMDRIQPSRRDLLGGLALGALAFRLPCAGDADRPAWRN